jgi:DNA-binding MarR family transcriptional regulator
VSDATALGNDLLRSAARLSRWASRHASFDVPFAQARLLALLDELGPSRISTLAAADHSSQPTISTQVHRVETAGWVDRVPDPDDARATLVSLSEHGRRALHEVRQARLAVLSPALRALEEPALERLETTVEVLHELLELTSTTTPPPTRKEP